MCNGALSAATEAKAAIETKAEAATAVNNTRKQRTKESKRARQRGRERVRESARGRVEAAGGVWQTQLHAMHWHAPLCFSCAHSGTEERFSGISSSILFCVAVDRRGDKRTDRTCLVRSIFVNADS